MKYGHIVISNAKKGFVASAIRFFTHSKFSHSLIIIPSICNEEMGLEAGKSGVSAVPFGPAYRKNPNVAYRMYRFRADPVAVDRAIVRSLHSLQTGYGYLEMVWFMWRGLNKLVGRDIKYHNNWSQAGIICSELVAAYITEAGYPFLFEQFGIGSVNAQDVLEICEAHPEIFELIETKE